MRRIITVRRTAQVRNISSGISPAWDGTGLHLGKQ